MYEVLFYDTIDGKCPVQDFLDSLEPKILAKTLRTIDLLEANGPLLREPYSKHIQNGLFELRTKQGSDITRVFYFFFIEYGATPPPSTVRIDKILGREEGWVAGEDTDRGVRTTTHICQQFDLINF